MTRRLLKLSPSLLFQLDTAPLNFFMGFLCISSKSIALDSIHARYSCQDRLLILEMCHTWVMCLDSQKMNCLHKQSIRHHLILF